MCSPLTLKTRIFTKKLLQLLRMMTKHGLHWSIPSPLKHCTATHRLFLPLEVEVTCSGSVQEIVDITVELLKSPVPAVGISHHLGLEIHPEGLQGTKAVNGI